MRSSSTVVRAGPAKAAHGRRVVKFDREGSSLEVTVRSSSTIVRAGPAKAARVRRVLKFDSLLQSHGECTCVKTNAYHHELSNIPTAGWSY